MDTSVLIKLATQLSEPALANQLALCDTTVSAARKHQLT